MDRFNSREDPSEWDKSAFRMGVLARQSGATPNDNPFKRESWIGKSWAAGWCDEDQTINTRPVGSIFGELTYE